MGEKFHAAFALDQRHKYRTIFDIYKFLKHIFKNWAQPRGGDKNIYF